MTFPWYFSFLNLYFLTKHIDQQDYFTKGPAIFNSGYPGGANMGGVRKIFDDF